MNILKKKKGTSNTELSILVSVLLMMGLIIYIEYDAGVLDAPVSELKLNETQKIKENINNDLMINH